MDVKTIYANTTLISAIVCDQCGRTKSINVASFHHKKPIKTRCTCGYTFFIVIEMRKFYRKKTSLFGDYASISRNMQKAVEKGRMTVENLSRGGLGFRTRVQHSLQIGDLVQVHFTLDNGEQSKITKNARVRHINGEYIGAEFDDFETYTDTNRLLGAYLMPR